RELYRALLGRRSLETSAHDASAAAKADGAASSAMMSGRRDDSSDAMPLIGRERELTELGGIMDRVWDERGRLVAILGEAGIGKSRLAAELTAEAGRRGARVLVGRAHQAEQGLHYGPWVDALRNGRALADGETERRLSAAWRAELA